MNLKKYLPSSEQVSKETIAVLLATVLAAWIISKFPAAQRLVRGNSISSPLDN